MELELIIAIVSLAKNLFSAGSSGIEFYKNISTIAQGNSSGRNLDKILDDLNTLHIKVERLSDHILYAPALEGVRNLSSVSQRKITDLREVRECLEPVQQVLGQEILSSSMISTPEKLFQAMNRNPFDILVNIRPLHYAESSPDAALVPVFFEDRGIPYIGWASRGALSSIFDCEYNELWLPPTAEPSAEPVTDPPEKKENDRVIRSTSNNEILCSERGVDYSKVEYLLKEKLWKEANQETRVVMLEAANCTKTKFGKTFDCDSIYRLPCTDLRIINNLWLKYSNGHFGFSIQRHIYDFVDKDFDQFCKHVGWAGFWLRKTTSAKGLTDFPRIQKWNPFQEIQTLRQELNSLFSNLSNQEFPNPELWRELIFSLKAPKGHLPVLTSQRETAVFPNLIERLRECGI